MTPVRPWKLNPESHLTCAFNKNSSLGAFYTRTERTKYLKIQLIVSFEKSSLAFFIL